MPQLIDLLKCAAPHLSLAPGADMEISGITADSRKVMAGSLFAAIPGSAEDGAAYIPEAIEKGAVAILYAQHALLPEHTDYHQITLLPSAQPRSDYAKLCAAFYDNQPRYCVAVTGTNGKTSVADFFRQLWAMEAEKSASIGTLGLLYGNGQKDTQWPSGNTSPAPDILHAALARLTRQGVQHVALEASSHGLDQHRLDGVRFAATAFTNLTQDHLDYHGTMEAYFEAKKRLFTEFDAPALVNADDDYGASLLKILPNAKSYGRSGNWLRINEARPTTHGITANIAHAGESYSLDLPLYGEFQLYNVLAACGLAMLCGMPHRAAFLHANALKGARGRMEKIGLHPSGATVFVDYAHTPDALKHLLISLRAHCAKKLHVVFGCGGERDTTKRAPMGSIAAEFADRVIITDDNPRSEDPESIRRQIASAAPDAEIIADRRRAIQQAITQVQAGDVLVVAGKGHETTQIIGMHQQEFNDAEVIREALGAL